MEGVESNSVKQGKEKEDEEEQEEWGGDGGVASLSNVKIYSAEELARLQERVAGLDDIVEDTRETLDQCEEYLWRGRDKENVHPYTPQQGVEGMRMGMYLGRNVEEGRRRKEGERKKKKRGKKKKKRRRRRRGGGGGGEDSCSWEGSDSDGDSSSRSVSSCSSSYSSSSESCAHRKRDNLKKQIGSQLRRQLHRMENRSGKKLKRVERQLKEVLVNNSSADANNSNKAKKGKGKIQRRVEYWEEEEEERGERAKLVLPLRDVKVEHNPIVVNGLGMAKDRKRGHYYTRERLRGGEVHDELNESGGNNINIHGNAQTDYMKKETELSELRVCISERETTIVRLEKELSESRAETAKYRQMAEESTRRFEDGIKGMMALGVGKKVEEKEMLGKESEEKEDGVSSAKAKYLEKEYELKVKQIEDEWTAKCEAIQREYVELKLEHERKLYTMRNLEKSVDGLQRKAKQYKEKGDLCENELYEERQRSRNVEERYQAQCKEFVRSGYLLLVQIQQAMKKSGATNGGSVGDGELMVGKETMEASVEALLGTGASLFTGPDCIRELAGKLKKAITEFQEMRTEQNERMSVVAKEYQTVSEYNGETLARVRSLEQKLNEREDVIKDLEARMAENVVAFSKELELASLDKQTTESQMRLECERLKGQWEKSNDALKEAENVLLSKQMLLEKWKQNDGPAAKNGVLLDKEKVMQHELLLNKYVTYKERVIALRRELKSTCVAAEEAIDRNELVIASLREQLAESNGNIEALVSENNELQGVLARANERGVDDRGAIVRSLKKEISGLRVELNDQKIKNSLLRKQLGKHASECTYLPRERDVDSLREEMSECSGDVCLYLPEVNKNETSRSGVYRQDTGERIAEIPVRGTVNSNDEERPFSVVPTHDNEVIFPHSATMSEFFQNEEMQLNSELVQFDHMITRVFETEQGNADIAKEDVKEAKTPG
eukprot:Nk52_evm1s355 gene=Nk52_evmTU1s355